MSWERVRFQDLGDWYGGGTPTKSRPDFWAGGSIPWLSPKDMGLEVLQSTQDKVTPDAVAGSSVRLVPQGSVAVVVRSGILDRKLPVAQVPFATTLNQDMKAVVPRSGIDSRWVAWGFRAFERDLLRRTRKAGTTVASIEMPRFYDFELPVPPLDEQRRIVDLLEDHLSRLNAAGSAVSTSIARLGTLRDAELARIVAVASATDDATSRQLGDLSVVGSGMTPLKANKSYYTGGTIPWVTSGDLHQGVVAKATQFVTQTAVDQTSLKLVPAGSLLVAMYGEGRTRGTVAELAIEATTNQACASVVLNDSDLRSWVRLVLDANYLAIRRLAAGGVQPNLNLSLIRSIEVPLPPPSVRSAALARISSLDDARGQLNVSLARVVSRARVLRNSLLEAAFSGRLSATAR